MSRYEATSGGPTYLGNVVIAVKKRAVNYMLNESAHHKDKFNVKAFQFGPDFLFTTFY